MRLSPFGPVLLFYRRVKVRILRRELGRVVCSCPNDISRDGVPQFWAGCACDIWFVLGAGKMLVVSSDRNVLSSFCERIKHLPDDERVHQVWKTSAALLIIRFDND
jgi:hypothetical protein